MQTAMYQRIANRPKAKVLMAIVLMLIAVSNGSKGSLFNFFQPCDFTPVSNGWCSVCYHNYRQTVKYHVPTKMVYQLMNFVAFVEPSL